MDAKMKERVYKRNRLHGSRQTYLRLIESAAESQRTPASPNTVFRKEKAMGGYDRYRCV